MIKCPGCGAGLRFDPASQKLACDYCSSTYEVETIKENMQAEAKGEENDIPKDPKDRSYQAMVFTCPNCGGRLVSTDETAATFCSYCGSSVLLEGRLQKLSYPDKVIPFKISKKECQELYRKKMKKAIFAPSDMKSNETIEKFRGIYMPYWIYDFKKDGPTYTQGTTEHRSGDYIIKKVYDIEDYVKAEVDGISHDAAASFSDTLSQAAAPYQVGESETFDPLYMSGFYADVRDVESGVYLNESADVAARVMADQLISGDASYHTCAIDKEKLIRSLTPDENRVRSGMFPVWFVSSRSKSGDRISYSVINGQTGKIAADIPVDITKYLLGSLILAIPIFLLFAFLIQLSAKGAMVITLIASIVSIILLGSQRGKVHARENLQDDKGAVSTNKARTGDQEIKKASGTVILKPLIGIILSVLMFVFNPVSDLWYYGAAIASILLNIWSAIDLLKYYNRQALRPLPQWNKRGGNDNE